MHTSISEEFSMQFKKLVMSHIQHVRTTRPELFQPQPRMLYGRRFKDNEQVYQALIMLLEATTRKIFSTTIISDDGPLARTIEKLVVGNVMPFDLDQLTVKALLSAADCDYYYEYEKYY